MGDGNFDNGQIGDLLIHQLRSFWSDVDEEVFLERQNTGIICWYIRGQQ